MRMAFADPGAQQFKSLEIFAKPGSVAGSDWPDPTFTQASLTSAPETLGSPRTPRELQIFPVKM